MKRLTLLILTPALLASCGAVGDPIASGLGIRNVSTITGESCTTLEASISHAGQELILKDTETTKRMRVQTGAPMNVSAKCNYTATTVVDNKPVTQTKTETLFTTRMITQGGDVYITTTSTPTGRRLLVAETNAATPAVIRASADSSACKTFTATITGAGTDTPITLSTVKPQDVGYVSIANPLQIKATCTGEGDTVTTLDEKLSLTGNTLLSITSSTDADGQPVLKLLAQ